MRAWEVGTLSSLSYRSEVRLSRVGQGIARFDPRTRRKRSAPQES